MSQFIRTWQEVDLKDVEKNLLVIGELSSECFACRKLGIPIKSLVCPECGITFKYIGFRRKVTPGYLYRIKNDFVGLTFIDFEDFKLALNKRDAQNLLGD